MPVASGGYKWVLIGIDTYSGLGFAYPVVDKNVQCTIKGPEQKILITMELLFFFFKYQGTHFHLQSNDLIENWNGKLKYLLSQRGKDKDMKGLHTFTGV